MPKYDAVECFWVEPTGKAVRSLRRYASRDERGSCPDMPGEYSYHNDSVDIGDDFDAIWREEDWGKAVASIDVDEYKDDDRWPTHCSCGYEFQDDDNWQANQEPIMASKDGRKAWIHPTHGRKPTPGAMFDTYWRSRLQKEDGLTISVVCPDGMVWCIDDEASSGGYWTRTGTPPKITARPSILTPDYHGWLDDGVLSADIDS